MTVRAMWVRHLQVDQQDILEPVCSEATCAPVSALVGAGAVHWAVRLADELGRQHAEAIEGAQAGAPEITAQRLGVESAVLLVLASLYRGQAGPPYVTADGVRQIEHFVQRRLTLAEQWAHIRQGHSFITDRLMSACRAMTPVEEQGLQLQLISRVMFDFADGFAAEVGRVYEDSERRWSESVHAARAEALDRVLSGGSHDVQDTSRRLSYDIEHRHHVGLVVYRESPSDSDGALAETALQRSAGDGRSTDPDRASRPDHALGLGQLVATVDQARSHGEGRGQGHDGPGRRRGRRVPIDAPAGLGRLRGGPLPERRPPGPPPLRRREPGQAAALRPCACR